MMLKRFLLFGAFLYVVLCFGKLQAQDLEELESFSVYEQNKHYPRTNVIPYDNEKDIAKLHYHKSSSYMNLNGSWKFKLQKGDILERKDIIVKDSYLK